MHRGQEGFQQCGCNLWMSRDISMVFEVHLCIVAGRLEVVLSTELPFFAVPSNYP